LRERDIAGVERRQARRVRVGRGRDRRGRRRSGSIRLQNAAAAEEQKPDDERARRAARERSKGAIGSPEPHAAEYT
jgi:hypothetical protein